MNTDFFIEMLDIESTSGRERGFADFLAQRMAGPGRRGGTCEVETMAQDCPEGCGIPVNLMVSWGEPKVVFCTHLDTVPPYIAPSVEVMEDGDMKIKGRGSCDAKGQIFAMWEACLELERRGCTDFALLLLAGEETGSFGAKAFNGSAVTRGDWVVIVGEPTDNHMTSASKGTKSFEVTFEGEAFHSGYPQYGRSAVEMFNDFVNALRSIVFPADEILGDTTWNIGRLSSDNPQNILSERLSCRVYFRTTFESDEMVCNVMKNMAGPDAKLRFGRRRVQDGSDIVAKEVAPWQKYMSVKAFGGDTPTVYQTLEGFPTKPVAFGSDAPQHRCFGRKILCGPDSILVAHRDDKHVMLADLKAAAASYVRMYTLLTGN
jgi:acetylornithine deacetylase